MPAARQARAANPRYSAASIVARTLVTSGRTWSWTPRIASTVAVAKLAEAATASILYAAARSVASRQARSGSSHRPVSMQAHCSADTVAPQLPRTPGARSRLRDSRSSLTASSDSSRSQAAAQSLAWPSTVPPTIPYRREISSPLFPNGSVAAVIHIRDSPARTAGQSAGSGLDPRTGMPGSRQVSRHSNAQTATLKGHRAGPWAAAGRPRFLLPFGRLYGR